LRLLLFVALVGCTEVPDGDFVPSAPPDAEPAEGWAVGFTPRGKPAEDVLIQGMASEAANLDFFGGAVLAGFQEEVLGSDDHLASLDRLLDGASAVQIVVPWYQADATASTFARLPGTTPTDASIVSAVERIHELGGEVMLTAFVDAENGDWRGYFDPTDSGAWFAAQEELIRHYAALSEELGVSAMSVGSEYTQTEAVYEDQWRDVIVAARGEFSGDLTYSANWNDTDGAGGGFEGVPFWDDLDAIGVDAWFPLVGAGVPPEVNALIGGWEPYLEQLEVVSDAFSRPVWFTEIGYASRVGSASAPWEFGGEYEASAVTQENGYRAFFERVRAEEEWLEAAFFWWWDNESTDDWAGY
jgi:hypothetical protein